MNLDLSTDLQSFVDSQVAAGNFANADEVVVTALRKLRDDQTKLEKLRAEIQIGLDDIAQGRVAVLDMEKIKNQIRAEFSHDVES